MRLRMIVGLLAILAMAVLGVELVSVDDGRLDASTAPNGSAVAVPLESETARPDESENQGGSRPTATQDWLRRLTVTEYIETVRVALGVEIAEEARRVLPPDVRADGFRNTAYNLMVDLAHVEGYARLARRIVDQLDREAFIDRFAEARATTDANLNAVIASMGRWVLRGPLDEAEVDGFLQIAQAVREEGGSFDEAVGYVLEAMLQSPRFLYRVEPRPQSAEGAEADGLVDPYTLASRLSYFLWGGPPDELLYQQAASRRLVEPEVLRAQVARMLDDPRAVERSLEFVTQWLDLDRLANMRPEPERFPYWDRNLAADMRAETLAFVRDVLWDQQRPLTDLLDAQVTYATPRLAEHYGLDWKSSLLQTYDRPEVRKGLLALYTFDESDGAVVRDRSGNDDPLDLTIADPSAVLRSPGRLTITSPTQLTAPEVGPRLTRAIKDAQTFTLEVWITPLDAEQKGPARILTLSDGPSRRNLTLGQDDDRFEIRCRVRGRRADDNGLPGLTSPRGSVRPRLIHLAFAFHDDEIARLYLDGTFVGLREYEGGVDNWDEGYTFLLGDEVGGGRPWRGTYHLIALHDRALEASEIRARSLGMARYDLTSTPQRGGLLTQGSLLTIGGDEGSTVTRGLFVLRDLLGGEVGDPPPGVDTTPVPPEPGLSQRAIAEDRIANPACGGCHGRFEPFAFGLTRYDGLGAYREIDEHGNELWDDGDLILPGRQEPIFFESAPELFGLLSRSDPARQTITRKLVQFALGRPLVEADATLLEPIHQAAQRPGGSYADLVTAVAMSDLVRMAQPGSEPHDDSEPDDSEPATTIQGDAQP